MKQWIQPFTWLNQTSWVFRVPPGARVTRGGELFDVTVMYLEADSSQGKQTYMHPVFIAKGPSANPFILELKAPIYAADPLCTCPAGSPGQIRAVGWLVDDPFDDPKIGDTGHPVEAPQFDRKMPFISDVGIIKMAFWLANPDNPNDNVPQAPNNIIIGFGKWLTDVPDQVSNARP